MRALGSIRLRFSILAAVVAGLTGVAIALFGYVETREHIDDEMRERTLHELDEICTFASFIDPRSALGDRFRGFRTLYPETGVLSLELRDASGAVIERAGAPVADEDWPEGLRVASSGQAILEAYGLPDGTNGVRAARGFENVHDGGTWIGIARMSREALLEEPRRELAASLIGAGVLSILVLAGSWLLLSGAFRPLHAMVDDAERVAEEGPKRRLSVPPQGSELRELAVLLNRMLDRVEASIEKMSRFTAFAGHELRTPLTRIRGEAEVALVRGQEADMRAALESALEEVASLASLVDALLVLARGESERSLELGEVRLDQLLGSLAEEARLAGSEREIRVDEEGEWPEATVRGSPELLARAIWNALDNAVRYSPRGSTVEVGLSLRNGHAEVAVSDTGPGFPAEDLGNAFEPFRRFVRPEVNTAGFGLGLAISRTILQRHGGTIAIESRPEGGTKVRIGVPLAGA